MEKTFEDILLTPYKGRLSAHEHFVSSKMSPDVKNFYDSLLKVIDDFFNNYWDYFEVNLLLYVISECPSRKQENISREDWCNAYYASYCILNYIDMQAIVAGMEGDTARENVYTGIRDAFYDLNDTLGKYVGIFDLPTLLERMYTEYTLFLDNEMDN